MHVSAIVAHLERTPAALAALVAGLSDADWRWRPAVGAWSILEVVNHLADEETLDFRPRVASLLEDPARAWPPIDPAGDVVRKRFQDRDPAESLGRFRDERTQSLAWLRTLTPTAAAWKNARPHRLGDDLHAGDLFASWAAHDARHLAQVARLLHGLAARDGAPWSVQYAG